MKGGLFWSPLRVESLSNRASIQFQSRTVSRHQAFFARGIFLLSLRMFSGAQSTRCLLEPFFDRLCNMVLPHTIGIDRSLFLCNGGSTYFLVIPLGFICPRGMEEGLCTSTPGFWRVGKGRPTRLWATPARDIAGRHAAGDR